MGVMYKFTCPNCNYQTLCVGGKSRGMSSLLQTMICKKCNELTDVVIETYKGDADIFERLLDKLDTSCSKCKEVENLVAWDTKTCPKCNADIGDGKLEYMWD